MNTMYKNKAATYFTIPIFSLFILMGQSCSQKKSSLEFAKKWTADLKAKILKESDQVPDKTVFDSSLQQITLFKNNKKLKQYYFVLREDESDSTGQRKVRDTSMIVFFSADQNFQYVRKPCIKRVYRSMECVAYKGDAYGVVEYNYCGKGTKDIGYQYKNKDVGTWTKYDSIGAETEKIEAGNEKVLLQLADLKQ